MRMRRLSCLVAAFLLAGCSAMLPRGATDTPSPFESFAAAQAAADRIVPFRTRVEQLPALGFDPQQGRNVTLIPYPEIVSRIAPYSGVPLDQLDPGIRACILAKAGCRAYLFHFERQDRKREGEFWSDFLNVDRTTNVTGWIFETLVVVGDGVVLFRNIGGQPHVERVEKQRNPLGPLQPAGESAGHFLLR